MKWILVMVSVLCKITQTNQEIKLSLYSMFKDSNCTHGISPWERPLILWTLIPWYFEPFRQGLIWSFNSEARDFSDSQWLLSIENQQNNIRTIFLNVVLMLFSCFSTCFPTESCVVMWWDQDLWGKSKVIICSIFNPLEVP